jgi:translation initiation factor 2A
MSSNAEIRQVSWQSLLGGMFPAKTITHQVVPSEVPRDEHKVAIA